MALNLEDITAIASSVDGESQHRLFKIVLSRSLHALIVGALFAMSHHILLWVVVVATTLLHTACCYDMNRPERTYPPRGFFSLFPSDFQT
jgi:hypothetical protein